MMRRKKSEKRVESDKKGRERIKRYQKLKDKDTHSDSPVPTKKAIIGYQNKNDAGWVIIYED